MAGINLRRSLFGGNDIAIDLGTANTLIYVKGVGVMVDEPTLIAVNKEDGSILTVGEEAKKNSQKKQDSFNICHKEHCIFLVHYFAQYKSPIIQMHLYNVLSMKGLKYLYHNLSLLATLLYWHQ